MFKILNSERVRALLYQILLVAVVIATGVWLYDNTIHNMETRGLTTGFDFLRNQAGFPILFSPFMEYNYSVSTYFDTFLIGIGNTLLVTVLGIVAATFLGFVIGVARLSSNWLISWMAMVYVEVFRNIPLLLQIMFWYFAVLVPLLPSFEDSVVVGESLLVFNNSGLQMPAPLINQPVIVTGMIIGALMGSVTLHRWSFARLRKTGKYFPVWSTLLGCWTALLLTILLAGDLTTFTFPVKGSFAYSGGWTLIPELAALWFALSIYTSAFIAEIVRAGIESVPKGQTEAARALGLHNDQVLRFITIPQALRLIIPPQTSQYLNLAKNSSLATAIGYPDLVALFAGTALNQVGKAVEIISMTMLVYLMISLSISALMNWYNHRIALTER